MAYGTWSFDWLVEPGAEHELYIIVFFMLNNFPRNLTGLKINENDLTGYGLILKSGSKGPLTDNSIHINKVGTGEIGEKVFSSPITGSHHIDITRSEDGEFNVYFDATDSSTRPIISLTDTTAKTSEGFSVGSWIGDSVIDNITVSDSVDLTYTETTTTTTKSTGTPSFELGVLGISFGLLVLFSRKRRP